MVAVMVITRTKTKEGIMRIKVMKVAKMAEITKVARTVGTTKMIKATEGIVTAIDSYRAVETPEGESGSSAL